MMLARSTPAQARSAPPPVQSASAHERARLGRRRRQRALAALLGLVLHASVGVRTAAAQSAQKTDEFSLGYDAAQIGDYEQAVRHFSLAYERDGDPLALYNLAQAYAASGDPVLAVESFERLLALPNATAEQRGWAKEALRVQRNRVGSVEVSAQPATAEVYLDGRLLSDAQRRRPVLVKVGDHTLVARSKGAESPLRQFSIVGQQAIKVELAVPAPQAATAPLAGGPLAERRGPKNTVSLVLGSTGAALLVGAGGLWLWRELAARSYNDDLGEVRALNPTSAEFTRRRRDAADDRDRVKTLGLAAAITGAGGLAALSIAWIAYDSKEKEGPSARLTPVLTLDQMGVSAVGNF